jgi:hypothetical protein
MMKAFGLVLMVIAIYLGMQLYTKDMERVVDQVGSVASTGDEEYDSRPGPVTHRVRDKVSADIARGAARYQD